MAAPLAPERIAAHLERAAEFFRSRDTLEGVLARRMLRTSTPKDADLADHLVRERRRRSRMDGSIGGSLVLTAQGLIDLLELGVERDHAVIVRFAGYLLMQQGRPGRWSDDGMAGDGFFSAGPPGAPVAPLVLPSGTTFRKEDEARFVASCLALRAVLRAGHEHRPPVVLHLERLLRLRVIEPQLSFVALGALGAAPPDYHARLAVLIEEAHRRQRPDGSWPDVTVFHAVDMLLGAPTQAARTLVRRAAPRIAAQQTDSGAFDATASEAIALIAVRALDAARAPA
jgi:hypothetical protein